MNENKNPLTQAQATKLTELITLLRPTWDAPGIWKALGSAVSQNLGDAHEVSLAAIRAARETSNRKPTVIQMPGNHWNVEAKLEATLQLLRATEEKLLKAEQRLAGTYVGDRPETNDPPCEDHPDQHLSTCTECRKLAVPPPPNFRELAGLPPKNARKPTRRRTVTELTTTEGTAP